MRTIVIRERFSYKGKKARRKFKEIKSYLSEEYPKIDDKENYCYFELDSCSYRTYSTKDEAVINLTFAGESEEDNETRQVDEIDTIFEEISKKFNVEILPLYMNIYILHAELLMKTKNPVERVNELLDRLKNRYEYQISSGKYDWILRTNRTKVKKLEPKKASFSIDIEYKDDPVEERSAHELFSYMRYMRGVRLVSKQISKTGEIERGREITKYRSKEGT